MIIFSFGKNTTGRNINVKPYPEILCWKRCPEFSSQPYIIYNLLNILMFILDPPPYLSVKPVSMLCSPIPLHPAHCWERYPGFPHWLPLAQVEAASICSCPQTPSTDINAVQCTMYIPLKRDTWGWGHRLIPLETSKGNIQITLSQP